MGQRNRGLNLGDVLDSGGTLTFDFQRLTAKRL